MSRSGEIHVSVVMFEFIEVFYNRQRHQAGLGHLTPAEYADKWRHDHGQPNPS